jgi:hypothetical protein
MQCGKIALKKILFINNEKEFLPLNIVCNVPEILEVITPTLLLGKDEGMYIKLRFKAPQTPSKFKIKLVLIEKKNNEPKEGIEIEFIVEKN